VHGHGISGSAAQVWVGDVADFVRLRTCIVEFHPNAVVHLAAETGTGQSLSQPIRHVRTNALGTATLLQALTDAGCKPDVLVLASSRAVYGEGYYQSADGLLVRGRPRRLEELSTQRWELTEPNGSPMAFLPHRALHHVPNPSSVYGSTKLAQEHLFQFFGDAEGVRVPILRFQNVYGVGQSPDNPYTGIIMLFMNRALNGEPIEVYEDGEITRDFIHVEDVVVALEASLTASAPAVLDIGSGSATTVHQLAQIIAVLCDSPPPLVTGKFRLGDVRHAVADVSAAQSAIGFAPATALHGGLVAIRDHLAGLRR
jgi:dTDP-L-rhamnose 4-epimerase